MKGRNRVIDRKIMLQLVSQEQRVMGWKWAELVQIRVQIRFFNKVLSCGIYKTMKKFEQIRNVSFQKNTVSVNEEINTFP
jgi:hypothetical protein